MRLRYVWLFCCVSVWLSQLGSADPKYAGLVGGNLHPSKASANNNPSPVSTQHDLVVRLTFFQCLLFSFVPLLFNRLISISSLSLAHCFNLCMRCLEHACDQPPPPLGFTANKNYLERVGDMCACITFFFFDHDQEMLISDWLHPAPFQSCGPQPPSPL